MVGVVDACGIIVISNGHARSCSEKASKFFTLTYRNGSSRFTCRCLIHRSLGRPWKEISFEAYAVGIVMSS